MSRGIALFDLDQTLLPFDTQMLFCNFVLRREGWRRVYLLWFLPCLPLAGLKLLSLKTMKRLFFSHLCGMKRETLQRYVAEFLETDFEAVLYPEVVAEVQRHRDEGRVLVLNSASPTFYLRGIAAKLGFDHCFGTELVVGESVAFLPPVLGPNNKNRAKVQAMVERGVIPAETELLGDSWAYSDSSADLPMLEIAENPVMIHPKKKLTVIGVEREWRGMSPHRPFDGRWGYRMASLQQLLGLYRAKKA